jgi:hypothetical protein
MNRSDLERVLQLTEQRDAVAERLGRVRELEAEVERDMVVERTVPGLVEALEERRTAIEAIARELEREWVAQGPLVTQWARAVEQVQLAEASEVDPALYVREAAAAEHRVESARLQTRDQRELLAEERSKLIGVLGELPAEREPPEELRDDSRPEALRRDALELIEIAEGAMELATETREHAIARMAAAATELDRLGTAADLERELAELNERLPDAVELPDGLPPSMEQRLRRAGIEITAGSRE